MNKVNFYKSENHKGPVDNSTLYTLCPKCAKVYSKPLELIDTAGDWDECEICGKQNVPNTYSGAI